MAFSKVCMDIFMYANEVPLAFEHDNSTLKYVTTLVCQNHMSVS